MQTLSLEQEADDDSEDGQRDDFLNHFQLYEREGTTVANEANAVGWNGKAILDEGDAPREGDDANEGPVAADAGFLQTQVTVPGEGHEHIAGQKEKNGLECGHREMDIELTIYNKVYWCEPLKWEKSLKRSLWLNKTAQK